LLREALQVLDIRPDDVCVDATIGTGGHARAILGKLGPRGRLIGIDRDATVLEETAKAFADELRVKLFRTTFDNLDRALRESGAQRADAILCDLGVSSEQLDEAERGFSFLREGPLDMRMDRTMTTTAAEIVARASAEELETMFRTYGEERHARRIARGIARAREGREIRTTTELADIVGRAVPGRGRAHPATRVFQALRIAVNGEMEQLAAFLAAAPECLRAGGRLAVISFHSLEDRLVKHAFRERGATEEYEVLTRKPLAPGREEQRENRRARSSKLRALRRLT
ncbi:MAG: 16S rRNA (cytosine(1402)-N(4))-methyltransferase RsmH, partial [Planctomycetota bacterium]